ncbi:MAG: hypothetical protein GEV03_15335 [Streptosporangiales bacterium]|nr:hypothetical protein [Streptosporangiales bacterium]
MYPPHAPIRVDPAELRPRRRWYVVAGAIAGVLVLAGVGGFAYGLATAVTEGDLGKRFRAGETVTVRLAPEPQPAIYVAESEGPAPDAECAVTSTSGGNARVSRPDYAFEVTRDGVSWDLRYVIDVTAAGNYQVVCRPSAGDVAATYRIGEAPRMARFFGGLFGGLASLFVLPAIGVLAGGVMVAVVAIRRNDHRRRLQADRSGGPSPGYPPQPPAR